jgi:YVTN family beta-propeller protein
LWAVAGAVLGVVVFRSWMLTPADLNPSTDGLLPSDSLLVVLAQAVLMAVPLTVFLVAAAAGGAGYLRKARPAGPWKTAWACAVSAAFVVEVTFIAVFIDPAPLFGQLVLGRANWGLLALSAAFAAAGAALVVIITSAAREGLTTGRRRALRTGTLALAVACLGTAALLPGADPPVIYAGQGPDALAMTPDGHTLYVADWGQPEPGGQGNGHTVTPISTATGTAGKPIPVGDEPDIMVVTPDGKTLYVAAGGSGSSRGLAPVTPVDVATGKPGTPIRVAQYPAALAVTPDSRTLYIARWHTVVPVSVATGQPGQPIKVGIEPDAMAVTPDGRTLYVASYISNTVTPVDVATGKPGTPITVAHAPIALAITPDGRTLYVAINGNTASGYPGGHYVVPINVATGVSGPLIHVGASPLAMTVAPDGRLLYVACGTYSAITPVIVATGRPLRPIQVAPAWSGGSVALAVSPDSRTLYVANQASGTVVVISLARSDGRY